MSVPVRKPCNARVLSYQFQDASRFSLYRFAVFSHLISAACHAATLAFHFKIIAFNEIFPTLSAAKLSPCAVFFAMDIKLCSIHGLARKAFNAFAILDPIYNNFPIENPECAHKDFREALRDLKISLSLACYAKHQTEASQEACTLNNDYGMKFSADYVCFTR